MLIIEYTETELSLTWCAQW